MGVLVEIDSTGRAILPGRPGERFLLTVYPDGSLFLEPIEIDSEAQHDFDTDARVRDLLRRATASPTVQRSFDRPD